MVVSKILELANLGCSFHDSDGHTDHDVDSHGDLDVDSRSCHNPPGHIQVRHSTRPGTGYNPGCDGGDPVIGDDHYLAETLVEAETLCFVAFPCLVEVLEVGTVQVFCRSSPLFLVLMFSAFRIYVRVLAVEVVPGPDVPLGCQVEILS